MDHLVGLTANGIKRAQNLHKQMERGLISEKDFIQELFSLRSKNVIPGHLWVWVGDKMVFVSIVAESTRWVPSFQDEPEDEPEDFDELDFGFKEALEY